MRCRWIARFWIVVFAGVLPGVAQAQEPVVFGLELPQAATPSNEMTILLENPETVGAVEQSLAFQQAFQTVGSFESTVSHYETLLQPQLQAGMAQKIDDSSGLNRFPAVFSVQAGQATRVETPVRQVRFVYLDQTTGQPSQVKIQELIPEGSRAPAGSWILLSTTPPRAAAEPGDGF